MSASQLKDVLSIMQDGQWYLPEELAARGVRGQSAAITARIRQLRHPEHGGYLVDCRPREGMGRVCEYRITQPPEVKPLALTHDTKDLDIELWLMEELG